MGCKCGSSSCQNCCYSNYTCPEFCTSLPVANSWNIPACGEEAVLYIPGLLTALIGSFLANPTYGFFEITGFNSINSLVTVVNNCYFENAEPGTIVPGGTKFVLSAVPPSSTIEGGWFSPINAGEEWSFNTSTSVNVPSDATLIYQKGDKVRFSQGGVYKYFYIADVPSSTVLTLTGGSDYTVSNAVIDTPMISREDVPFNFPDYFNWNPTQVGFAALPTSSTYQFVIKGKVCTVFVHQGVNGTSNSTSFTISAPLTAATVVNAFWGAAAWNMVDNGASVASLGVAYLGSAGTTITIDKTPGTPASWTNANGKRASFTLSFLI